MQTSDPRIMFAFFKRVQTWINNGCWGFSRTASPVPFGCLMSLCNQVAGVNMQGGLTCRGSTKRLLFLYNEGPP